MSEENNDTIYIDAHLCKKECSSLGIVNQKYDKGVIYLALYKGPWLVTTFLQNNGYVNTNLLTCNLCNRKVQLVRKTSELQRRFCRICNDFFTLETVSWSTHSFTVYHNQLVRDKQLSECEKHYSHQDEIFI